MHLVPRLISDIFSGRSKLMLNDIIIVELDLEIECLKHNLLAFIINVMQVGNG